MENNQDFIKQIQQNKGALLQLMSSPDGQRLIQLLSSQSGDGTLKKAASNAAKGNTSDISQMISKLMQNPEGAALVERINRSVAEKP